MRRVAVSRAKATRMAPDPQTSLHAVCAVLQGAMKVMAKDLIRTRHSVTKFYGLKSQLQGVSLRVQVTLAPSSTRVQACGIDGGYA